MVGGKLSSIAMGGNYKLDLDIDLLLIDQLHIWADGIDLKQGDPKFRRG